MKRLFRLRSVALIATIAMMGATAFVASGATGAAFSDTESGTVAATFGTISLDTSSTGLDFTLDDILPGETRSVTIGFENNGGSPQDVYFALGSSGAAAINGFANNTLLDPSTGNPVPVWGTVKITRTSDTQVLWNSPFWPPFDASGNLLIRSNLASGDSDSFTVEVAFDIDIPNVMQGHSTSTPVPFRIVATQVGGPLP